MNPVVALVVSLLLLLGLVGCDRGRAEAGREATRVVHTRDRVEDRVRENAWQSDTGTTTAEAPLMPLADTPLALGKVETLAETDRAAIERQEWSFQDIRGVSYRVRLPLDSANLKVVASDTIEPLSALVDDSSGDFAAINGGFYDVDNTAMGVVVSGSEELARLRKNGGSGVVELRDGDIRIVHRRDWEPGADEALQSIDRIVAGGKSLMTEGRRERHAARSAIAVGEDYLWLVVAVEVGSIAGEAENHAFQLQSTSFRGMPLWAFARYLLETTDVVDALNLDGAVSTQMKARVGDIVVDIRGERGTINALVVR